MVVHFHSMCEARADPCVSNETNKQKTETKSEGGEREAIITHRDNGSPEPQTEGPSLSLSCME